MSADNSRNRKWVNQSSDPCVSVNQPLEMFLKLLFNKVWLLVLKIEKLTLRLKHWNKTCRDREYAQQISKTQMWHVFIPKHAPFQLFGWKSICLQLPLRKFVVFNKVNTLYIIIIPNNHLVHTVSGCLLGLIKTFLNSRKAPLCLKCGVVVSNM